MEKHSNKLSQVKDMPINEVMSLSRSELIQATRSLTSAANRRLTTMKKKGLKSPSTEYIRKHGGRFSLRYTKGKHKGEYKNVQQLREEFQRAKGFLESETSTVKGFRKWEKDVADTLAKQGIDYNSLTPAQKRRFWQAFAKVEELDQANTLKGSANYKAVVNEIYDAVKDGLLKRDLDDFAKRLNDQLYMESRKDFVGSLALSENPFEKR